MADRQNPRTGGDPNLTVRSLGEEVDPCVSLESENVRLKRRLERERQARAEAEAITEKSTRDLYARQRLLALLEAVATAACQCDTLEAELAAALKAICLHFGWTVAHVYNRDDEWDELVSDGIWYLTDKVGSKLFKTATEGWRFSVGVGLPGRVLETGKPLWIENLQADANFPRANEASAMGVRSAFAFPLLVGPKVVAVLEFFVSEGVEPDAAELEILALVGAQLGRAVERNRAADKLERSRDEALAATRAKSEFLANMSHEIRTPMYGIMGMADILLDEPLPSDQLESVAVIRNAAEKLLAIIDDILDFSKIEVGKLTIQSEDFDLRTVIESVAHLVGSRAYDKGIELNCFVPPGFPDQLVGLPGRVQQIITNLAGNAIKFTDNGEVFLEASVVEELNAHVLVKISVRDTGIGIPVERREAIFDSFTQADGGICRKYSGTGLGLTISNQLAGLMGGSIELVSEVGVGSTFTVILPFAKSAQLSESYVLPTDLSGARILVLASNRTVRETVSQYLAAWGFRLSTASNSDDAFRPLSAAAESEPFALALFDIDHLGHHREETARRIKLDPVLSPIPLILLDRMGPQRARGDFREPNFSFVLTKPVRQLQLYNAVLRALGRDPSEELSRQSELAGNSLSGMRILLADDDPVNQLVSSRILSKLGCAVSVVGSGPLAIAAVQREKYDLVLMDCQMPEMSGFDATSEIRRLERANGTVRLPIVALTANAMTGDREACLAAGMDDYLSKPVRSAQLHETLIRWRGVSKAAKAPRVA